MNRELYVIIINKYKSIGDYHFNQVLCGLRILRICFQIRHQRRLPENWSAEKLMKTHSSEPFNPNIAHGFYLAGFIESWGRGVEKICDACGADNAPLPEYDITGNFVVIKFTASEDKVIRIGSEGVTERATERVTEKELKVLSLLRENPSYTYNELAEKLHVSRKTVSVRIAKLRNKGIIFRVGSDTEGHWQINE